MRFFTLIIVSLLSSVLQVAPAATSVLKRVNQVPGESCFTNEYNSAEWVFQNATCYKMSGPAVKVMGLGVDELHQDVFCRATFNSATDSRVMHIVDMMFGNSRFQHNYMSSSQGEFNGYSQVSSIPIPNAQLFWQAINTLCDIQVNMEDGFRTGTVGISLIGSGKLARGVQDTARFCSGNWSRIGNGTANCRTYADIMYTAITALIPQTDPSYVISPEEPPQEAGRCTCNATCTGVFIFGSAKRSLFFIGEDPSFCNNEAKAHFAFLSCQNDNESVKSLNCFWEGERPVVPDPDPVQILPTCQNLATTISTPLQTLIKLCERTENIDKTKQLDTFNALKEAFTPVETVRSVGVAVCDPGVDGQATLDRALSEASTLITAVEVGNPTLSLSDKINYYCNTKYRFTEPVPVDPANYCSENRAAIPGLLQTAYQDWQNWFTQAVNAESQCNIGVSPEAEGVKQFYALLDIVDRIRQCKKEDYYDLVGSLENWGAATTAVDDINKDRPSNAGSSWYAQSIEYACNILKPNPFSTPPAPPAAESKTCPTTHDYFRTVCRDGFGPESTACSSLEERDHCYLTEDGGYSVCCQRTYEQLPAPREE